MSTQSFNPDSYKNGQEQEWDAAAAGWRKQWAVFETSAQSVNDRLVDLAEIKPEDRVLDIVTGIGEPAVTAAKFVGAGGRVVATDQSTGMLAIAKERVAEFGLNNVEFQATDAEALDFPEGSFDAVVCRWGLMFLPDVGAALSEIRKSLFPRGKFVTSVGVATCCANGEHTHGHSPKGASAIASSSRGSNVVHLRGSWRNRISLQGCWIC